MKCPYLSVTASALAGVLLSSVVAPAQLASRTDTKSPEFVKKTAFEIDKRIGSAFQRAKVTPVATSDDPTFLRRIYLDVIGRIPTYEEAKAFLDDKTPDKRAKLIDKLLNSEGYVSHTYNWYCDILRATSKLGDSSRSGVPYLRYLRKSVVESKPWDKFVYDLLTSSGRAWAPDNGAVGYFERDRGMPLDNMANTTRIFLGTHIECAQCHDHPYDNWKQMDFYEMAAFTHGLQSRSKDGLADQVYKRQRETEKKSGADKQMDDLIRFLNENFLDYGVEGAGDGLIKLPPDFHGKGGKPDEMVRAKSILAGARNGSMKPMDDGRQKFAEWLTSPKNERFVKILANRLWKRAMGVGLFEPVDKFRDSKDTKDSPTVVSNPEALAYMEQLVGELKFDVKACLRVLYNTRTYALGTNPMPVDTRQPYTFHGRMLRRLSAEQVWDSLTGLVVPELDYRKSSQLAPTIRVYGREVLAGKKTMFDIYKDVSAIKSADEFYEYAKTLLRDINSGGGGKVSVSPSMMMQEGMMSSTDKGAGVMDAKKWDGYNEELLRASELPSPMPPAHFLRKFGQSSREVIEGSSTENDVTQVLSLMNGHVEKNIVSASNAVIYKVMDKQTTPQDKLNAIFLTILSRPANEVEVATLETEAKKGQAGLKNIIHALLNSSEFMFIQ